MAVNYNLAEIHVPGSKVKHYAPRALKGQDVDMAEISHKISRMTKLSELSAQTIMSLMSREILKALEKNPVVSVGDLGTFSYTIRSRSVARESDFKDSDILKVGINFRPSSYLKKWVRRAKFEKTRMGPLGEFQ